MNKKIKMVAAIIIFLILGAIFYWYSYRPSHIVSKCSFEAKEKAILKVNLDRKFGADDRDAYYKWCLQENGLVK